MTHCNSVCLMPTSYPCWTLQVSLSFHNCVEQVEQYFYYDVFLLWIIRHIAGCWGVLFSTAFSPWWQRLAISLQLAHHCFNRRSCLQCVPIPQSFHLAQDTRNPRFACLCSSVKHFMWTDSYYLESFATGTHRCMVCLCFVQALPGSIDFSQYFHI